MTEGFSGIEAVFETVLAHPRDAQERVVGRPFEPACVEKGLVIEVEQRRFAGPLMREHVVGALPERVPEQDRALEESRTYSAQSVAVRARWLAGNSRVMD